MQRKQGLRFGVILASELVTKRLVLSDDTDKLYNSPQEKILYKNLTEEEYFDIMEDLSIEYYQKGSPNLKISKQKSLNYKEYYGSSF